LEEVAPFSKAIDVGRLAPARGQHHGHADVRTTMSVYGHVLNSDYAQAQAAAMLEKALAPE
jgi:hypothetical protein